MLYSVTDEKSDGMGITLEAYMRKHLLFTYRVGTSHALPPIHIHMHAIQTYMEANTLYMPFMPPV